MSGGDKKSEWFVGSRHDELLEATKQMRKTQQRIQAQTVSREKKHAPTQRAIPSEDQLRQLVTWVKELFEDNYDDVFDVFTELDVQSNGKITKREFCEGLKAIVSTGTRRVTDVELEHLFAAADKDKNSAVSLKEFVDFFGKQKLGHKTKGGVLSKTNAQKRHKRPFDEVLIDVRDERGIERTFPVDAQISFPALLEKLESKFQRPVTLMYEVDGHSRTIKSAGELKDCWDALEREYSAAGKPFGGSAHFEAFAVNFDDAMVAQAGAKRTGKVVLAPQKASGMWEGREGGAGREAAGSMDFAGRHKWIDGMMRVLGVPVEDEPPSMQGLWDVLAGECRQLDPAGQGAVTVEGFRNALTRTEPRMSPDQVEWFVMDADKSASGDVLYREYVRAKKEGRTVAERVSASESAVQGAEAKIAAAIREHFPSLQAAFRRMDADRDGRLSQEEFRKGVEQRLKVRLTPQLLKAVIHRASASHDGFVHYQDFLERFRAQEATAMDGAADVLTDMEMCRQLLQKHDNIIDTFTSMDADRDGRLNASEVHAALQGAGLQVSMERCQRFLASFDIDGNRVVDYREFLRKVSQVDQRELHRARHDALSRKEDAVRMKLRERFDSAMQAFNAIDADADGRLSLDDWQHGVESLYRGAAHDASKPSPEELRDLFHRADGTGSGYVAYHEFLHRYHIAPKPTDAAGLSFDRQVRAKLKSEFGTATEAFEELDIDKDNRLSVADLQQGLAPFFDHEMLEDDKLQQLIARASTDSASTSLDYYDFLVHFGLEQKAEGRWEKVVDEKVATDDMSREVSIFKKHMRPSKWFGRGGVLATLRRFDDNGNGRLERGEFLRALRDGLGMKELTDEEAMLLLGKGMDKPYCHKPNTAGATGAMGGTGEGTVDIPKFMYLFVDVHFELEKTLFDVLLVQNRWQALEEALAAFRKADAHHEEGEHGDGAGAAGGEAGSSVPPTLISKAEFGAAMARLVKQGLIKEAERLAIIRKCELDLRFEPRGPWVGFIDYRRSFLDFYIREEREIHAAVSPHWEGCMRLFRQRGEALKYAEFSELCHAFALEPPLSEDQIEALIDVIDANGDGTIALSEFVHRYAGDDAELLHALGSHWQPLLTMLNKARLAGEKESRLTRPKFQSALLQAVDLNVLGGIGSEQVRHVVERTLPADGNGHDGTGGKPPLIDQGGGVLYVNWLKRYVGDAYDMHMAFQGVDKETSMPKWDAVISLFQDLDRCLGEEGDKHEVSWDHFRKVLRRARIDLRDAQVSKLIAHLDPRATGRINWLSFVRGVGPGGAEKSPPYFFNGGADYEMRALLVRFWPELLEECRKAEKALRKESKELLPASVGQGVLTRQRLEGALKAAPLLKLADQSKDGKPTPNPLVGKVVEVATKRFSRRGEVELRDREGAAVVDYVAMCRLYAGEAFDAERKFERRWEMVISVLKELGKQGGDADKALTREVFVERLSRPELDLTDAMVDFLVPDQPAGKVDLDTICWRCGRHTIVQVLQGKWSTLMRLFRAKDAKHTGKLDSKTLRSCLDRADVGLSSLQVDILMGNLEVEPDGKYDYDKLLSGKLKGGSFGAEAYVGWRTMESLWEQLAESFWEFDVSGDGKVSPDEFTRALLQLKHPALSEKTVIEALVAELNPDRGPEIQFDPFSWRMAFASLRDATQNRGRQLLDAFRAEAGRLYGKHRGGVPKKEAEKVFGKVLKNEAVRPLHLKILVNKSASLLLNRHAVARCCEDDGLVTETLLAKALRELVGEQLGKQESEELRRSFSEMQAAATVWAKDHWHQPGPGGGKTLEAGKQFWGVASLGGEALRVVGERGVRRRHMHFFFREGGRLLPRGMEPSPTLTAIKDARERTVYNSEHWRTFWAIRNKYRTPEIKSAATQSQSRTQPASHHPPAAAPARPPARAPAPQALVAHERRGTRAEGGWPAVSGTDSRIKRAMADKYGTMEGAVRALDPAGSGAVSMEAVRGAIESLGIGLSAAEVDKAVAAADRGGQGFLLHAEFAQALMPPPPDLHKLAQARESQGIYARLRSRLRAGAGDATLGTTDGGYWDSAWRGTWGGVVLPGPLSPGPYPPAAPDPGMHPPPSRSSARSYVAHPQPAPQLVPAEQQQAPAAQLPLPLNFSMQQSARPPLVTGPPLIRDGGGTEEIRQLYQNTLQQLNMLGISQSS